VRREGSPVHRENESQVDEPTGIAGYNWGGRFVLAVPRQISLFLIRVHLTSDLVVAVLAKTKILSMMVQFPQNGRVILQTLSLF